jgi:GNAT superfamily N-acetyltransferase/hypoxanthine-guanine phosphoribosyltransferase
LYIYLDTETFERILHSLASRIKEQYQQDLPNLLGFGVSGSEVAEKLRSIIEDNSIQAFKCDVARKEGKIESILHFPDREKIGKKLLICDTIVDTGRTMETVMRRAWKEGVEDVKTLSVAVRKGCAIIPNFYAFMVEQHDYVYFPTLREYPTTTLPKGLIRTLRQDDLGKPFKCGKTEIDKIPIEQYIEYSSKGYLTYVIEDRGKLLGILHFYSGEEEVEVEILAVAEFAQKQGYGSMFFRFLADWCRFNRKRYIALRSQKERVHFYQKMGFEEVWRNSFIKMRLKVY